MKSKLFFQLNIFLVILMVISKLCHDYFLLNKNLNYPLFKMIKTNKSDWCNYYPSGTPSSESMYKYNLILKIK